MAAQACSGQALPPSRAAPPARLEPRDGWRWGSLPGPGGAVLEIPTTRAGCPPGLSNGSHKIESLRVGAAYRTDLFPFYNRLSTLA
jgi:hypothetical protein